MFIFSIMFTFTFPILMLMMMMILVLPRSAVIASSGNWSSELNDRWVHFKTNHRKHYRNSAEEGDRRNVWSERLSVVSKHNLEAKSGKRSFTLDLNELADLLPREYEKMLGFRPQTHSRSKRQTTYFATTALSTNLPSSVNWLEKGWVSPVQNQGLCGSCWSFAACGAIESQLYNLTKKSFTLSEQNLIDCTLSQGNNGCEGGNMQNAFRYVKTNPGIDAEDYYPFKGKTGATCEFVPAGNVTSLKRWHNIQSDSELALQQAVALVGPISAGLDARGDEFQLYRGGVYSSSSCSNSLMNLNHAVLVVGYGNDLSNQPFWLIKNSWGKSWGDRGYMMLARNRNNMCGIATDASFPIDLIPSKTFKYIPPTQSYDSATTQHLTNSALVVYFIAWTTFTYLFILVKY